jgi:hypothetical protein
LPWPASAAGAMPNSACWLLGVTALLSSSHGLLVHGDLTLITSSNANYLLKTPPPTIPLGLGLQHTHELNTLRELISSKVSINNPRRSCRAILLVFYNKLSPSYFLNLCNLCLSQWNELHLFFFYLSFYFFGGTGAWTLGLMVARQAIYLSHSAIAVPFEAFKKMC